MTNYFSKTNLKSLAKEALTFYKSVILRTIRRIPFLVFAFLALFGAVWVGIIVGYESASIPSEPSELEMARDDNRKLRELVDGYEEISKLYYEQGVNVGVLMDMDSLINDPLKVRTAIRSMEEYRDLINFQSGRIQELRKSAGYGESKETY